MYNALHDAVRALPATGPRGFEGLSRELIQRVLGGKALFLSRGGAQQGRDAGTSGYDPEIYVDLECKQYQRGDSPRARDLIGGLSQAINASREQLDLWILVTTTSMGSAAAEELRQVGNRQAVTVEIVDWQETDLPRLAVLCAAFSSETLRCLAMGSTGPIDERIRADLESLRNHSSFDGTLAALTRELNSADVGLAHAGMVANTWIETRLTSKAAAVSSFNQPLCVDDVGFQPYIQRSAFQRDLGTWYENWGTTPSMAAVLGHEGTGKSWLTLAWWRRLTVKPLTLVVTSNSDISGDAETVLASALTTQTAVRDVLFWQRRLRSWLRRPQPVTPMILLILDGLNERSPTLWDRLFASLSRVRKNDAIETVSS